MLYARVLWLEVARLRAKSRSPLEFANVEQLVQDLMERLSDLETECTESLDDWCKEATDLAKELRSQPGARGGLAAKLTTLVKSVREARRAAPG